MEPSSCRIFDSNIIINHDETMATIMDFEEATDILEYLILVHV